MHLHAQLYIYIYICIYAYTYANKSEEPLPCSMTRHHATVLVHSNPSRSITARQLNPPALPSKIFPTGDSATAVFSPASMPPSAWKQDGARKPTTT